MTHSARFDIAASVISAREGWYVIVGTIPIVINTAQGGFRLKDPADLDPTTLPTQLDEVWREAGLRGAVLLYALPPAPVLHVEQIDRIHQVLFLVGATYARIRI